MLEARLVRGQLASTALGAALESIGQPAFLVGRDGRVDHANSAGREHLARDRVGTLASLAVAASGRELPDASAHRVRSAGLPATSLVLLPGPRHQLAALVEAAARGWALTPRQREVLLHVARGESNRAAAALLRCSESAVAAHVSSLLIRADAGTRAELVARVLRAP